MQHTAQRRDRRAKRRSVLILCEGAKTEPNYLSTLVRNLGLSAVIIPRDNDTDPLNLVRRAIRSLKADASLYAAYVVFDRDDHVNFAAAVATAQQHPLFGQRLFLARSYPSFEYWLLLHFERCRAPLNRHDALHRLIGWLPNYEKGSAEVMDALMDRVDTAMDNADFAWLDAVETQESNPSTEVQNLIRLMIRLASEQ